MVHWNKIPTFVKQLKKHNMKTFYTLLVVTILLTIVLAYLSILIGSIVLFGLSLLSLVTLVTALFLAIFEKKSKIIA